MARITYNILTFASIFILEWYLFLAILIIGIFLYEEFYEGLIYGVFFDLIYGSKNPDIFYLRFTISGIFVLALIIGERVKKYLRYYPENV